MNGNPGFLGNLKESPAVLHKNNEGTGLGEMKEEREREEGSGDNMKNSANPSGRELTISPPRFVGNGKTKISGYAHPERKQDHPNQ